MIRDVTLKDAQALSELNTHSLGYQVTPEETEQYLQQLLSKEHHILLLEENDQHEVLGYIHGEVYQTTYAAPMLNILGLAVSIEQQRQGVATRLMHELEIRAKDLGFKTIRLNSGSARSGAHLFYQAQGFEDSKEQKRFLKTID